MAIRVFLNTWSEEPHGNGIYIKDPIDEYLADVSLSAPVVGQNYYARLALNNRPDKLYLIKVMRGNLQESEWTLLGGLPGVLDIPPHAFDLPIDQVKNNVKNKVLSVLSSMGIPETTYTSAATVGGFLRNVLFELDDNLSGFGDIEQLPEEWA